MLLVPHQDTSVIKSIKKRKKSLLPTGVVTKISDAGNFLVLSICFRVKDASEFEYSHDDVPKLVVIIIT